MKHLFVHHLNPRTRLNLIRASIIWRRFFLRVLNANLTKVCLSKPQGPESSWVFNGCPTVTALMTER